MQQFRYVHTMKHKTLLPFQLFLIIFAFFALSKYSGNQCLDVSLVCRVSTFLVGKVETRITEPTEQDKALIGGTSKEGDRQVALRVLDYLLKNKNLLLHAIHYLLQDLGLVILASPDYPAIERLVRIPGSEVTYGVKILSDVAELNENWDKREELVSVDAL
jgi:hypothetical protein